MVSRNTPYDADDQRRYTIGVAHHQDAPMDAAQRLRMASISSAATRCNAGTTCARDGRAVWTSAGDNGRARQQRNPARAALLARLGVHAQVRREELMYRTRFLGHTFVLRGRA